MDKKSIINEIKILAMERDLTLTQVASLLSEKLNKKYSLNNLSQKLRKETIPYREIKLIRDSRL